MPPCGAVLIWDLTSGSKKKVMTIEIILLNFLYLDEEVHGHYDEAALLDTAFPGSKRVVVVGVDDEQVDEDKPNNVNDQREHEHNHHNVLVALPVNWAYSKIAPCDVCEEKHWEVVVSSAETADGADDRAGQEEVRNEDCEVAFALRGSHLSRCVHPLERI